MGEGWSLPPRRRGMGVNHMASDYTYCHRCGARMGRADVGGKSRPKCDDCGAVVFLDPKVAVVVVASLDDKILMVKRDIEPMFGKWAFPSGYVDRFEPVEEAAVREVEEETTVKVRLDALLGVYSRRGDQTIVIAYAATILSGDPTPADETQDARLFPMDELPPPLFPFDGEIIGAWRGLVAGS